MDYESIITEFSVLIGKLDSLIDIMFESTKEVIDLGNVNYELNKVIDRLDIVIDSMNDSNEKTMLESAKHNITYATLDITDNVNTFDKIERLKNAKCTIMNISAKLCDNGHL